MNIYLGLAGLGALMVGYYVGKNNTFGWNNGTGYLVSNAINKGGNAQRKPTRVAGLANGCTGYWYGGDNTGSPAVQVCPQAGR